MNRYQKLKSLLLLLFVAVTAKAQLEHGKVYNFVNVGNTGKSMTSATAGNYLSIATTDEADYSQLWYCASDGNGFTLRNLGNGNYLRSPNAGGNTNWILVKTVDGDNCRFSCTQESGHDVLRAINTTDSYHYMHYGATTGTVVCWTSSAPATQWDFTEVSGITSAQLNANWEALAAINPSDATIGTYQTALDNLFSDKVCTTLKKSFANEDAVKNDADYKALPTTLQQMVLKVYKNSWAEDNYDANKSDWDADYAQKYRVQLYEPYNEPEAAAAALGLNAHTNLNNPTGIFSGGREAMYVMVEGEIEEGASLYMASYSGHGKLGGYQNGVELKQGLNVVPSYFAGNNYCINYVVHTFDTEGGTKKGNKAKARKLSDYEDLKIHIEGGYINGYWNKMGDYRKTGDDVLYTPDKNDDWDYIAARATQTDVTVLGEYITLQFPLGSAVDNNGNTNNGLSYYYTGKDIIESSIQEWDNVMMWERIVLGVLDKEATEASQNNPQSPYAPEDVPNVIAYIGDDTDGFASGYDDYYNVHGLSFGTPHGYMYGGWDHCGYHFNTMGAIMTSMITDAGSHWGPAHEIGHQHQGLLTVNGLTEVTNNLFSNVVLWYFGKTTSRVNGSALEPIAEMFANEEADFFNTTSNVFITTQMYYKLFLYYHVLGHNPKFYPKLFEMLRQDPMSGGYNQNGSTSILHFYKKCCEAAGEDLTEFFRAYGFFRVMTNRLVGDYSNSVYNQTQKDIDDAIAEVKASAETKGWEENIAVLFINDDTGGQILSHRSDTEYLKPFESADSELGSYATFNEATIPNYTYTIVGTTVTMEGEGGIGFAIYNENGEIIGFSDNKTFEVSVECAEAIASGKAVVKTVQGDNEAVEAVNIMDTDDTDAKRAMLGELVESAKAVLDLSDEDGTKVGFYRASSLEALESAYTQAEQVYEARTVASYSAVYNALFHEYFEVMNDSYARIGLVEGNAYRLTNKAYATLSMSVETSDGENKDEMFALTTAETDAQLWYFEASDTDGRYYLQNKSTKKYPGNVSSGAVLKADKTKDEAYAYELRDMGQGVWALVGNTGLHCSSSQSYNIVGWGADSDATQWYITAVDVNENAEALFSLQGMVEKTKDLAGEMANVQYSGKLALQAVSESEPYYLSTNACHNTLNNASDGQGLAGLLDDDTETFFHSDYGGKISNTHYLQVDLGSGNTMSKFAFNYTTRSNGNNCPTEIVVAGSHSNDGTFTTLQTYTATNDNLPNGKALSWESPVIENTANYRYLRFSVTATENSKKYFVMSTFGITNHETVVKSIEEKYYNEGLTEQTLKSLGEKFFEANELMASDAATFADLQTMCSSIENSYYTPLLKIYNDANAARLTALKSELSTLISRTTTLIGQCGTVTYTPGTFDGKAPLQTTKAEKDFFVWTNAQATNEGPISHLVDGDQNTYFHSDYSGSNSTDELDHHITVNLGKNNKAKVFTFKYITRHNADTNYPTAITIYGREDDEAYEEITSVTEGLPTGKSEPYSTLIEANKYYSHLRFMVTANSNTNTTNGIKSGHPIFHMAELELVINGTSENYTAELKPEHGDADTDLLIETFKKNAEAKAVCNYATTELQVEAAIAKLQAQYDILKTAKDAVQYVDFTIKANVTGGGVTYNKVEYTGTLRAPSTLTAGDLTAMPVDGYVAKSVTIDGTTISVVYNKVYTVNVEGLAEGGGVVYEGNITENGKTFDAPLDLTVEDLSAVESPEGYAAGEITLVGNIVTVTYKKIYTVNVVGVAGQGGVVFESNNYTDAQELQALNLEIGNLTAMPLAGYVANVALEGTTITVTYNKIYTIQVVGLDGQGGVQFGDDSYTHGQELNALDLQVGSLIAIVLEGYVANVALEGTTITVTYKKVYTVNVVGINGQGGVLFGGDEYEHEQEIHVQGTLDENQLEALSIDGYAAYISVVDATIHVTYKMIYRVEVVGGDGNGAVTFEGNTYANNTEVHALSTIEINQLTAVDGSDYVGTITLDGRTIRVTYCKLVKDLSELKNYKAYQIRAKSGEGYFAYNSSITQEYVSLRGMTNWSYNRLPNNESVANKYKEVVSLSDKTVAWQIIKEGEKYYLYQPEKGAYVTRDNEGRDYKFTAEKTALDGIRQNNEDGYEGTFGIHAGGGYSDESKDYACIVTNEATYAVRDWTWKDHGAVLQIIENPYVYALDYAVQIIGNVSDEIGVEFEGKSYVNGETLSATELLTAGDLTIPAIDRYESSLTIDSEGKTITLTYTIDQTDLIALIAETENLVGDCYTDGEFSYTGSLNVTESLIAETNEILEAAILVRENPLVDLETYDNALAALETAKRKLETAIAYVDLPVQLTFDVNSPVTYKITICRDNNPVLAYDNDNSMVAVTAFELGNTAYGWYFVATTDGKVRIMPYYEQNTTLALSTNSFSEGNSKVLGMAIDTEGYTQEWTITANSSHAGWYNITTINPVDETIWYFSNHGGVSKKMGFYNNANDGGSLFMFRKIRILNITDAYSTLYNYYTNEVKVASGNVVGMDDTFGYYSVDAASAYNTAYNEATRLLESSTAIDDEYTDAYKALKTANEALVKKGTGKFYTIKNGDLYITGSTTSSGRIALSETKNADAIYYYDGNHLLSYSTGLYIGLNESDWTFEAVGSTDISKVEFSVSTTPGAFNICCGGRWLHRTDEYVNRCTYNTCGDAHNWIIEEVTELPVSVNANLGFASFYAPVALRMPKGMTAYVVTGVDGDKAPIAVLAKEGEVIPANTGVLLNAEGGNYNLAIADNAEAKVLEGVINLLHGTIDDQYIEYDNNEYGNNTHYMLGLKNNLAGLYVVAKNLTPTGKKDEANGTHFKNNGFKSYLTVPDKLEVNALRFFVETTEIDEMEAAGNGQQEAYIYDLQGRRVLNPTNGMYIVNGKKVVIK